MHLSHNFMALLDGKINSRHRSLLILCVALACSWLAACRGSQSDGAVARQVVMVDGEDVVVTRLVQRTGEAPATVTPASPGEEPVVLDMGLSGPPQSLDPQTAAGQTEIDLVENLFVGLTRFNHATSTVQPDLATEWEVSEGGRTWTFHLRSDVFWVRSGLTSQNRLLPVQTGPEVYRPVLADDLVYAVQRACDPRTQAPEAPVLFIIEGCEAVHGQMTVADGDLEQIGVTALDETTVQITLTEPASYFPAIASLPLLRPVPREIVGAYTGSDDSWASVQNVLTSGRFIIDTDTEVDTRLVLRRSPYWPTPFSGTVDRVSISWLDSEERYERWVEKGIDVALLPPGRREEVMQDTRLRPRMDLVTGQGLFYLAYNFESPIFSDPAVRRAFGAAIDRQALIEEVYEGMGVPMRHFTPPGVVGASPIDEVGVGYSPDWARLQMQQSSAGACSSLPEIRYLVGNTDLALFHAETVRDMWKRELGCLDGQIVIEQVQFGTLLADTRPDAGAARPDIWDLGWTPYYPDAHNWLGDVLHCTESENRQNRPCSQADALIAQAGEVHNVDERRSLYRQAEQLFFSDDGIRPVAPLFVQGEYRLVHPWLIYEPAHFGGEQYDTYQLDATTKRLEQEQ